MKNKIFLCIALIGICFITRVSYSKNYAKLYYYIPDNATTYVYIDSVLPSEKVLLQDEDYQSLRNLLGKIKYYNPRINPISPENIIWGSTAYAIEMQSDDKEYTISIGFQEIGHGIRTLYISDSAECLAAYISDDITQEIKDIFQKYFNSNRIMIEETKEADFK